MWCKHRSNWDGMEMNCTKLRAQGRFSIRRNFARSRLEADYLARVYEIIVPIYKRRYLEQRDQNRGSLEKEAVTFRQFGIGG